MGTVSLDKVQKELWAISDDVKFAQKVTDAMAKMGHRWHYTPPDRFPALDEVQANIGYCCDQMMKALRESPNVDRQRCGLGGITVLYVRWDHGAEQIEVYYAPEMMSRSISRD